MQFPEPDRELVASDGTRIAYGVSGSGPALLLTNGLTTDTTFWKYLAPRWARAHTVICWDLPGHGRSGPAVSPRTAAVEGLPAVMAALLDALGIERAVQVGWSTGCQVVLEFYRQRPERCRALALLFGPAGRVLDTTQLPLPGAWFASLVSALPESAFARICKAVSATVATPIALPMARRLGLIGPNTRAEDALPMLAHIGKVDPSTLRTLLLSLQAHSAHDVLRRVHLPLLIFAGDRDPFAPSATVGIPLHDSNPDSTLVRVPDGTHTALWDEPELIAREVERLAARAT